MELIIIIIVVILMNNFDKIADFVSYLWEKFKLK